MCWEGSCGRFAVYAGAYAFRAGPVLKRGYCVYVNGGYVTAGLPMNKRVHEDEKTIEEERASIVDVC
jgi:hypothetical protein